MLSNSGLSSFFDLPQEWFHFLALTKAAVSVVTCKQAESLRHFKGFFTPSCASLLGFDDDLCRILSGRAGEQVESFHRIRRRGCIRPHSWWATRWLERWLKWARTSESFSLAIGSQLPTAATVLVSQVHQVDHVFDGLGFIISANEDLNGQGRDIQTGRVFHVYGKLFVGQFLTVLMRFRLYPRTDSAYIKAIIYPSPYPFS